MNHHDDIPRGKDGKFAPYRNERMSTTELEQREAATTPVLNS